MFKIFFRCRRSSPWFDSCPSKRDPTTAGQVSQSCHNSWTAEAGFRRHSGFQSTLAITIPLQQLCLAFSSKIFEKIEFNKMIEWILAGSERRNESAEKRGPCLMNIGDLQVCYIRMVKSFFGALVLTLGPRPFKSTFRGSLENVC